MTQILEKDIELAIDDIDYKVVFTVEASCSVSYESYEHFGFKGRQAIKDFDFELNEILGVSLVETPDELIKLDSKLERKIRSELHEWISNNSDVLEGEVEF